MENGILHGDRHFEIDFLIFGGHLIWDFLMN